MHFEETEMKKKIIKIKLISQQQQQTKKRYICVAFLS